MTFSQHLFFVFIMLLTFLCISVAYLIRKTVKLSLQQDQSVNITKIVKLTTTALKLHNTQLQSYGNHLTQSQYSCDSTHSSDSTDAASDPLDKLDHLDSSSLDHYHSYVLLASGHDAVVYKVVDGRYNSSVAMKLTKGKSGRCKTEIYLLNKLKNCPYIVKLLQCMENKNPDSYVLILECATMSLADLLQQKYRTYPMPEHVAKSILFQILKGIKAIHNLGFVHKDIKPGNILLFANTFAVKIADFGFATRAAMHCKYDICINCREKYVEFQHNVSKISGTAGYWAPELVTTLCELKYAFKLDVFSAGVTFYTMLCNKMPFGEFNSWFVIAGGRQLYKIQPDWKVVCWIRWNNNSILVPAPRILSDMVKDLLSLMLQIRPQDRGNIDMCLTHPFFIDF